ncbi:MAG: Bug family tripartite tricarboxylate transporter substrate binding protein [Burkholderiales bacterium]
MSIIPTLRVLAVATVLATGSVLAQSDWPNKPIRIIVPSAAGGAADFTSRTFGRYLEAQTKQPVVIDNRAGAGGIVGTEAAKNAPGDGYTYLLSTNSTHAANVSLFAKLPYDPQKDFEAVGMFGSFATVAMVKQGSALRSIADVVQYARANPGKLTFGYYSSSSQVPPELLKARTNIEMTGAPYKNITQIVTDLGGGVVEFAFLDMLSAAPALQSGRMTPIAVTAPTRLASLPNVPAVAETIPGYEVEGWIGLTAPAGTPRAVIERMNALIAGALADPAIKGALEKQGMNPRVMRADELKTFIAADQKRWAEWVRLAKIPPQ